MAVIAVLTRRTKRDAGLKQHLLSDLQKANIRVRVKGKGTYDKVMKARAEARNPTPMG